MGVKTQKQKIGATGEEIACKFLVSKGFHVIQRNYRKKFGEIDIICRKDRILHFIEVKSVSRDYVSHGASDSYNPEDNIHKSKLLRIGRTIQAYLSEIDPPPEWEFHAVLVNLNHISKVASVSILNNIVL